MAFTPIPFLPKICGLKQSIFLVEDPLECFFVAAGEGRWEAWRRNSEATFSQRVGHGGRGGQKVEWGDMSEFNLTRVPVQKEHFIHYSLRTPETFIYKARSERTL